MNTAGKAITVVLVAAAVASAVVLRNQSRVPAQTPTISAQTVASGDTCGVTIPPAGESGESSPAEVALGVPRLLDLGSGTCTPCKMMVPVLDELRAEYAGKLQVDYISVKDNPAEADRYGIDVIPTQIFFDKDGKELSRHVGYWPKADILDRFSRHGIQLEPGGSR
jgi:thioredoxin 1